jgi:hypothetical protein
MPFSKSEPADANAFPCIVGYTLEASPQGTQRQAASDKFESAYLGYPGMHVIVP